MLRNNEVRWYFYFSGAVAFIACYLSAKLPFSAWYICLAAFLLILTGFFIFTKYRYEEIARLSQYIEKICSGEFELDVRDNFEGELSILKNDIQKVTRMLSEQAALLKKDKNYLADALSDISHQLKTPLTSMQVMAELLQSGDLPSEKRHEFTDYLHNQLERMNWLVTTLLKMSKIDAGTAIFKKEKVNVYGLLQKAIAPLLIPAELRRQEIILSGEREVSFLGDEDWTIEAVVNIVKNCIEHTPQGGKITVNCSENSIYTQIEIQDNGCGIHKEDLPFLFQRFYRGKNASDDSIGIGLAMAKAIVNRQEGIIIVESQWGEGARFLLRFHKKVV